ncbi:transmembrane domain-containing protein [Cryptosporidium canis]|nr:transmembrane domain-containing protein [Cryptosporidium canis]
MSSIKNKSIPAPHQNPNDSRISIIPNTTPYKFMRGFMCFVIVSLSMLYLVFSCSFAIKYKPLVFDNILTETIKGTIKGSNGEYIQWIATIPTGLVSRTVAIICVVMFLVFGVYTMIFSFYTACKKYKFIQPWHFMLLAAMSCVGGLISIFLSNKFGLVEEFTGKEDCLIQSVVSNDCSTAIGNNEIYAYDLCKAVESFCLDENSAMYRFYIKAIIVAVVSFLVSLLSFVYGIILLKLKMKYTKKSALLEEKNKVCTEMSNTTGICLYENKCDSGRGPHGSNMIETACSTADHTNVMNSTKTNVYCQNITDDACKAVQPYQGGVNAIPMGIVVTTTTSKQCHIAHQGTVPQASPSNMGSLIGNSAISCINSMQRPCHTDSLNTSNRNAHNGVLSFQHHHHHHHHHHHGHTHGNGQNHGHFR